MSEQGTLRFLSGAEMEPVAVRSAYPDARFIARARIEQDALGDATISPVFAAHLDGAVWGILIDPGLSEPLTEVLPVTTDDGRLLTAAIGDGSLLDGEPDDVLAAARYWELPPPYVGSLKTALAATDEDPSDGN